MWQTVMGVRFIIQPGLAVSKGTNEHRRRIELEDKAKVVASDWGTESLPS